MIDRQRLDEELRKMRELIRDDHATWARFDVNGNSEIDGDEWEQVRQLVVRRLEREVVEVGRVACQIYERDLPTLMGPMARARSLAATNDVILEQRCDAGRGVEDEAIRQYSIFSPDGGNLGTVKQGSDLEFAVATEDGQQLILRASNGPGAHRVEILDAAGGPLGYVQRYPGVSRRNYHVVSTMDRGTLTVESQPSSRLSLIVRGPNGTHVGTIERRWSGLGGFLGGGNRTCIQVQAGKVTTGQRWGLVATALLEDLTAGARTDLRLAGTAR